MSTSTSLMPEQLSLIDLERSPEILHPKQRFLDLFSKVETPITNSELYELINRVEKTETDLFELVRLLNGDGVVEQQIDWNVSPESLPTRENDYTFEFWSSIFKSYPYLAQLSDRQENIKQISRIESLSEQVIASKLVDVNLSKKLKDIWSLKEFYGGDVWIFGDDLKVHMNPDYFNKAGISLNPEDKVEMKISDFFFALLGKEMQDAFIRDPFNWSKQITLQSYWAFIAFIKDFEMQLEYGTSDEKEREVFAGYCQMLYDLHRYSPYTFWHDIIVSHYLVTFAGITGVESAEALRQLHFLGQLHDVGKLDNAFIDVNGSSSDRPTIARMQNHVNSFGVVTRYTGRILNNYLLTVLKDHHQNYDSTGYPKVKGKYKPRGKRGLEIPVLSQIIRAVDSKSATESIQLAARPHRSEFSTFKSIIKDISSRLGAHYAPWIGKFLPRFMAIYEQEARISLAENKDMDEIIITRQDGTKIVKKSVIITL